MKEKLLALCQNIPADYVEVRVHEGRSTSVDYAGKELEDIGERTGLGGCVRVLKDGGWGFSSFNDLEQMEKFARLALRQAELVGGGGLTLAPVEPRQCVYRCEPQTDPADVPLADKQQLCHRYNELLLADPRVRTSVVRYRDSRSARFFANSEGTYIEQHYTFCGLMVVAIAVDGNNVQRAYESTGDLRGFENALGAEERCERVKQRAVELLSAKPIEAGTYTVIVDPKLCGVFVHEAFGHLSEADYVYENPRLREIMRPGRRFGRDLLNICDDGSLAGEAGFVAFDDEGVPTRRTPLIKGGVLAGRLHNRETAARMNEQPTGNARAISHAHPPIVRMTNTYMEPLAEKLREVVLTGNVFKTLADIDAVANDLTLHGGLGGCGKGGQSPLRVADGGPHCRIRNVVIGGR